MSLNRSQQIAYLANLAFSEALSYAAGNGASDEDTPADVALRNLLTKDRFLKSGGTWPENALKYAMQPQFTQFARELLKKVSNNPYWIFLSSVCHDDGHRTCLYLLYMEAVGAGVGFWDDQKDWENVTDQRPPGFLSEWAAHFTDGVRAETPAATWPLLRMRQWRAEP